MFFYTLYFDHKDELATQIIDCLLHFKYLIKFEENKALLFFTHSVLSIFLLYL